MKEQLDNIIKKIMKLGVEIDGTEDQMQIVMAINDARIELYEFLKNVVIDENTIGDMAFKVFPLPDYEKDEKNNPLEDVKDVFNDDRMLWLRGAHWVQRQMNQKIYDIG